MNIQIRFKENSSPKFQEILKNARKFQNIKENGEIITININNEEIKKRKKTIKGIISRIKDWDDSEFYLNSKMVSSFEMEQALQILICEGDNKNLSLMNRTCNQGEGWGCAYLNNIFYKTADENYLSLKNWYDYGKFDKGDWLIDKAQIKKTLLDEVKNKHIDECSFFTETNIDRVLETIPTRINPNHDPNWEYRYRNSSTGALTREIIGIQPKKNPFNQNPFGDLENLFGNSSPLTGLFDAFSNLDFGDFGDSSTSESNSSDSGNFFSDILGGLGSSSTSSKNRSGRSIPNTTFEDIGGMEKIVQQVKEVIELPIIAPDLLNYYNIKPHKGILLYGPPGCGKTLLAKAVANEINAHFISISGPEILNKYLGQSEENLRSIFKEALNKAPSIIYFDEFDSLATHRNQELDPYNSRVVNQLLTLLDGIDDNSKICIIASTNRIDMIDEAIKRPGRFDYVLEVTKPTLDGCKQIFNIYTKNMPIEEGFDKEQFVTQYLFGSTGAEIAYVATEAAYNSIRRTVDIDAILKGHPKAISSQNIINEKDFLKAINSLNKNRENRTKKQVS